MEALAVNNDGAIVGYELSNMTDGFEARLWWDDVVYELQDLAVGLPAGHSLARAIAVNEIGDITADARIVVDEQVQFVTVLLTPIAACAADLAPDDVIDVFDLFVLLQNWGTDGAGAGLAERTDVVDVFDLFAILAAWGPC